MGITREYAHHFISRVIIENYSNLTQNVPNIFSLGHYRSLYYAVDEILKRVVFPPLPWILNFRRF